MYDALRAKGIPAQIQVIEGTDHGFIGATKEQAKQWTPFPSSWTRTSARRPRNKSSIGATAK
jgi:hypothetical protein